MQQNILTAGQKAPDFCLSDQNGNNICLKDFRSKWVVLYFYPKDNTPGCTIEAIDFTKYLKDFEKIVAVILGISPDSCQSHVGFINKHNLQVTLLSDPEHKILDMYGVWQLKNMYGKKYWGVIRSTFLIAPDGKIAYIWPKVNPVGHTEEVLKKLEELKEK